jgi:hypothetical protein
MAENPRTTIARDHDDSDLIERADELPMPSHSGASGAGPAENIGSRDELKMATGADPTATRVRGGDKAPTKVPTRADFDGG